MAENMSYVYGSESLQEFLLQLFRRLEQNNVAYCVLRNYQMLPKNIGNDVDMLVLPKDRVAFESCILDAAKATGWSLLMKLMRYGYRAYWFQSNTTDNFVHFDVWTKISWKGLRWVNEDAVLSRRIRYKQFYVPCSADEACISLIKDIIQIGSIKDKYKLSIKKAAINNSDDLIKSLQWGVGESLALRLRNLIEHDEWATIINLKDSMRRAVLRQRALRKPVEPILGLLLFLGGYMRALAFNRSGIFIVFIGPDGSGKSTIADGLMQAMKKLFPAPLYYHGRFFFLPDLRDLYNILRRLSGQTPLPPAPNGANAIQNTQPHSKLRVCMYLFYYFWDYMIGYWVISNIRSKGQLLIFDRYFYDYFIQQQYSRLPKTLAKTMLFLIPKPDIIFYLKCEPAEIHKRKPELKTEQIIYQQKMIESNLSELSYYNVIDTQGNSQESISKIMDIIIGLLRKRNPVLYNEF